MSFFFKMNLRSIIKECDLHPLFGDLLKGEPYVFDFSSKNPKTLNYNLDNFQHQQSMSLQESAHKLTSPQYQILLISILAHQ